MEWILQLPILFFSVVVHEFFHGWMAYRYGDDTAYLSGRLTFNPIPHIDPLGTVLLPLFCRLTNTPMFGWAKPVPVNPLRLHHPRQDMVKVALMGPAANLILVLLAAVSHRFSIGLEFLSPDLKMTLTQVMRFTVILNLYLAFFNLIPVHPLDGSQVLSGLLPRRWLWYYQSHAPYGFFIILFLMATGVLGYLVVPPVAVSYGLLLKLGLM
ncbi:MAG: site-2 protease family protein [Elusimicrobia bacterium]|nr:site-2 protease family protein [Elusimicrobiota bacterium]